MEKGVRDDAETISPVAVSCSYVADKAGGDGSFPHHIATPGIPCGRDRQPDIGRICDDGT